MPSIADRAANVTLYAFESAQLASDTFQVLRFEGTEGISEPFKFKLQLLSEDPDIDFSKVVNETATFTMMRGDEEVPINGIVTDFSLHGRTEDYVVYRATLRPRLHRLSLSYGSRIFQEKKVEDILRTVLKEAGFSPNDFRFALQASYTPREYCVQYEETDLSFISRLMEFEGMYYFFEHEGGQDTLVITDKKSEHEKIPAPASLRYHEGAGGMVGSDKETVRQLVCEEQMVTGKVQLRDYNYRGPKTMTAESGTPSDGTGERYEYGDSHFRDTSRGNRLADVRKEEIEARKRVVTGESDSMGFRSGFLFTLEKHYRKSLNADYLITQIEHRGSQRAGLDVDALQPQPDGEPEPEYRNHFTCIPATVQYRPPRETPKPEVPGVLTAKIETAGGDYAYIDDQGRYHAKMHFDRLEGDRSGRSEGSRSLPIRMKQAYSGSDYGIHFPNHADTEMIVAFENGDIDRPIALGTAPNPSNASPVVSDNKSQNIIRSNAGNEVLVEDQEDETEIRLTTADGHRASLDDGADRIRLGTAGGHEFVMDDDDEYISILSEDGHGFGIDDGDFGPSDKEGVGIGTKSGHRVKLHETDNYIEVTTEKGHTVKLDDDEKKIEMKTKKGHVFAMDDDDEFLKVISKNGHGMGVDDGEIGPNDNEGVGMGTSSGHQVKVHETKDYVKMETSGGAVVKASDKKKKIKASIGENELVIDKSKGEVSINASSKINLECGASSMTMKSSGKIEIEGMKIKIDGTQKVETKAMNIKSKAKVKNDVKGTMVNSKAKGINKVGGSLTKVG
jgi:type VI secretion system secreted protein VgrG